MSDKILSIIVPSYNMEAYLPKCLGSLIIEDKKLSQKLDVIVVNDGSKDRTSEIAHEFREKYPSVFRVIDKDNGHYGSCINAALRQLHGRFVKVLDADDAFATEGLLRFLKALEDTEADLVLSDWLDVLPAEQIKRSHNLSALELMPASKFLEESAIPFHAGITYRTDIFSRFTYSQLEGVAYTDLEWVTLPLAVVKSVIYIPEIVYRYTVTREGQTSDSITKRKNYWMVLTMYLDLVSKYEAQRKYVLPTVVERLDRLIALRGESFYRQGHILGADVDFRKFDAELKVLTPTLYSLLANCRDGYSRFNFVALYRRQSVMSKIGIFLYCFAKRLQGYI